MGLRVAERYNRAGSRGLEGTVISLSLLSLSTILMGFSREKWPGAEIIVSFSLSLSLLFLSLRLR